MHGLTVYFSIFPPYPDAECPKFVPNSQLYIVAKCGGIVWLTSMSTIYIMPTSINFDSIKQKQTVVARLKRRGIAYRVAATIKASRNKRVPRRNRLGQLIIISNDEGTVACSMLTGKLVSNKLTIAFTLSLQKHL